MPSQHANQTSSKQPTRTTKSCHRVTKPADNSVQEVPSLKLNMHKKCIEGKPRIKDSISAQHIRSSRLTISLWRNVMCIVRWLFIYLFIFRCSLLMTPPFPFTIGWPLTCSPAPSPLPSQSLCSTSPPCPSTSCLSAPLSPPCPSAPPLHGGKNVNKIVGFCVPVKRLNVSGMMKT